MNEKIKGILSGLFIIALGVAMIYNPDMMNDAEASGRRSLFKSILIWVWSLPVGVIATLLGRMVVYGAATSKEEEQLEGES